MRLTAGFISTVFVPHMGQKGEALPLRLFVPAAGMEL